MELRHARMMIEVARTKSLTRASENLFLSQSALSHQLKEVENLFQVQLFIRQKKQMLLTREGEVVVQSSHKMLEEMENVHRQLKLLTEKDFGEIRVSTECYTSYPWLSGFLREFKNMHPKVDIHINAEATRCALAHLLDNKLDVGIFENNKNKKLRYTSLFSDEFHAIVPPDHPWCKRKWVELEAFAEEAYIMHNVPLEESTLYPMLFKNSKPTKLYQVMLTEAILEMVKAGLGVTVQPLWVATRYLQSNEVRAVRITRKGLKRTWYAGVLNNKLLPPYVTTFINHLAKHMKQSKEHSPAKS